MSLPTTLFIDTSIFESQHYDFESREFSELKKHFGAGSLTLVLPDPIKREINRHIKQKVSETTKALKDAQAKASFLRRVPGWPDVRKERESIEANLLKEVTCNLDEFLKFYNTADLGYENIDLTTIMNWFDSSEAPFGVGKKAKEFPDAFAVAILDNFFSVSQRPIAVISKDSDFKKACEVRSYLMHFESISAFVAAKHAEEKLVQKCVALLANDDSQLITAISRDFEYIGFVLDEDWDADFSQIKADKISFFEINVIEGSGNQCKVSYSAEVEYTAEVTYDDYDSAVWDSDDKVLIPIHQIETVISKSTNISGSAVVCLNGALDSIKKIDKLVIDQDTIEVSARESVYD